MTERIQIGDDREFIEVSDKTWKAVGAHATEENLRMGDALVSYLESNLGGGSDDPDESESDD
jgi:hypothetical protein